MSWGLTDRYEMLAGRLSERELAKGNPSWLVESLVPTDAARERLRRWAEQGGLERPTPSWTEMRERLNYVGDDSIGRVVVAALAQIAPPARDYILTNTWVCGVGRQSRGWAALAPPAPAEAQEALRLVVVSGAMDDNEDLAAIVAHECAHTWLAPVFAPADVTPIAERRQAHEHVLTLAAEWNQVTPLVRSYERSERHAATLARAWGFVGSAADPEQCARLTSQHLTAAALMTRHEIR